MVAAQWVGAGLLVGGDGHETSPFVRAAVHAAKTSLVRGSQLTRVSAAAPPPCLCSMMSDGWVWLHSDPSADDLHQVKSFDFIPHTSSTH